ncbi:hypothetical protein LTR49_028571, partial [Elasticomyces elasticus]
MDLTADKHGFPTIAGISNRNGRGNPPLGLSFREPPPTSNLRPIGKIGWIVFANDMGRFKGVWTRQIVSERHKMTTIEAVKPWFEAVTELYPQHRYLPEHQYNIDESGFAMGT